MNLIIDLYFVLVACSSIAMLNNYAPESAKTVFWIVSYALTSMVVVMLSPFAIAFQIIEAISKEIANKFCDVKEW